MVYIALAPLVYSALRDLEKRVFTVACTNGRHRWRGLTGAVIAGAGLVASCGRAAPPPAPASQVRLTQVRAVRHAGTTLVATAQARVVHLDPATSTARLEGARLGLPGSGIVVTTPSAVVDLAGDRASGDQGVVVTGPAWRLTGRRFTLAPAPAGLEVDGAVDAHGEVAR